MLNVKRAPHEKLNEMTFPNLFRLYIWLVDLVRRSNGITLDEINKMWVHTSASEGKAMSRSSFLRHKDEISDIFGINITCSRDNGYRYFLEDCEIFKGDSVQNWMISTLSVNNVLSEGLSLYDRLVLEAIPSSKWLQVIIEAMKCNMVLLIDYKKYSSAQGKKYEVEPYSLKLYRRRWYMLCVKRPENEFRTFSLDRIRGIERTEMSFELAKDFSASEFYKECYGVVHGTDTVAEHIVIRAYGIEAKSLRDLPIHPSQRELPGGDDEHADFSLFLRPTRDFRSEILGRGIFVKVLEPTWLADEIADMHRKAAKMYEREGELP